nr:hypothetical protein [Anaerolinea sp.]
MNLPHRNNLGVLTCIILLLATACAPAKTAAGAEEMASMSSNQSAQPAATVDVASLPASQPGVGAATVHFTLTTGAADGKMVFIGVGGDIDGKTNPDLAVQPGDTVEITLVNGDGVTHDLVLPDSQVASGHVSEKDAKVKVVFKATE